MIGSFAKQYGKAFSSYYLKGRNAKMSYAKLATAGVMGGAAYLSYSHSPYGKDKLDTGSAILNLYGNLGGSGIPGVRPMDTLDQWNSLWGSPSGRQGFKSVAMGTAAGALLGGALGATTTSLLYRAIRSKGVRRGGAMSGLIFGSIAGAFQGYKTTSTVFSTFSEVSAALNNQTQNVPNRAVTGGGAGYRTWSKRRGGRMPVGHLGSDGSLVHAMHKARHRSNF